jgi:hypothetical protein
MQWFDLLWAMSYLTVFSRTIFIAMILGSSEHRYVLMSWPSLLWCGIYGTFFWRRLRNSTSSQGMTADEDI